MNCKKHPSSPAVAQCSSCGSYVCEECATKTESAREKFGTLCIDCYKKVLYDSIDHHKSKLKSAKTLRMVCLIPFAIGVVMIIAGIITNMIMPAGIGILISVIGYILMGVLPAFDEWRQSRLEEYEAGAIVLRIIMRIAFGPIQTFALIKNCASTEKESAYYIEVFTEELATL